MIMERLVLKLREFEEEGYRYIVITLIGWSVVIKSSANGDLRTDPGS